MQTQLEIHFVHAFFLYKYSSNIYRNTLLIFIEILFQYCVLPNITFCAGHLLTVEAVEKCSKHSFYLRALKITVIRNPFNCV